MKTVSKVRFVCAGLVWSWLGLASWASAEPPLNDACRGAEWTGPDQTQVPGTLAEATEDGSALESPAGQPDVWYIFEAPSLGVLHASTCGSHDLPGQDEGPDTILSLHSGCPGTIENEIAGNDDAPSGNDPEACAGADTGTLRDAALAQRLEAGEQVLIRISRYAAAFSDDFVLNLRFVELRNDCNENGIEDEVDLETGTSQDANGNSIPDECEPPARLRSVTPDAVGTSGGAALTILGQNLGPSYGILIGGSPLLDPQYVDDQEIRGTCPELPEGRHDVTLTLDGAAIDVLPEAIEALSPPGVEAVNPAIVPAIRRTRIVVYGASFLPETVIRLDERPIEEPVFVDSTRIEGYAPALGAGEAPGPRDVIAEDFRGTGVLPAGILYAAPEPPLEIASFAPEGVSYLGRTGFEIRGQGFTPETTVSLTSASYSGRLLSITVIDDTRILGIVPADPQAIVPPNDPQATIAVSDPFNGDAELPGAFRYVGPLVIDEITPPALTAGAGGPVTIRGSGFTAQTLVTIDGIPLADATFMDPTTLEGTAPPLPPGTYDVIVSDILEFEDVLTTVRSVLEDGVVYGSTVSLSVAGVTVDEGDAGTRPARFTVSLSAAATWEITVNYSTADGTAAAPSDYHAVSGTLAFSPGSVQETVSVDIAGDTAEEPDETFTLRLAAPQGATIAAGEATATIRNDDAPQLSDLILEEVAVDPPRLAIFAAGEATATVRNTGPADLAGIPVRFEADGILLETAVVDSIPAGETRPVSIDLVFDAPGSVTVTATVNADGAIPETRDDNNSAETDIEVAFEDAPGHSKPDLELSALTVTPPRPQAGEAVTVEVELADQTMNADPGTVHLDLVVDGEAVDEVDVEYPMAESFLVGLAWPAATPGRHWLSVRAASVEPLDERRHDNNRIDTLVRVGGAPDPLPDLEVRDMRVEGPPPNTGASTEIVFELRNEGYAAAADLPVVVTIDGREAARRVIPDLGPGASAESRFDWVDIGEGQHLVTVHVDPDDVVDDDSIQPTWSREFIVAGSQYTYPKAAAEKGWRFIGPEPIDYSSTVDVGRITSIAVSPTDRKRIVIGAPLGGVWSSYNSGVTWTAQGDYLPSPAIDRVALDPRDDEIVYAFSASGEIFKSFDGGAQWTTFAAGGTGGTGRPRSRPILRYMDASGHPDTLTILLGTLTGLWVWQGDRLEASTASSEWTRAWSPEPGHWAYVNSLVITGESPPRVYIGVEKETVYRIGLATLLGNLSLSLADQRAAWEDYGTGLAGDRAVILLGNSPAKPSQLYATLSRNWRPYDASGKDMSGPCGAIKPADAKKCSVLEFYRREKNDTSWKCVGKLAPGTACGINYNAFVAVHPKNADIVYVGGVKGYRTLDGGKTWSQIPYVHDDYKSYAFDPVDPTIAYFTSDGGVYKCTNNCAQCSSLNQTLATTQFFDIALSATSKNLIVGGTQDNGTIRYDAPSLQWKGIKWGDGKYCAIDPSNDKIFLAQHQYAVSTVRTTNGAANGGRNDWTKANNGLPPNHGDNAVLDEPFLAMHPTDGKKLLICAKQVYRSTTGGTGTWEALGPAGLGKDEVAQRLAIDGVNNRWYAGTKWGRIWAARESAPKSWSIIYTNSPAGALHRSIAGILVDPGNPEVLYVTVDASGSWRVLSLTHSGGWPGIWKPKDLSADLPKNRSLYKVPPMLGGIVKDPRADILYIGTDRGVYRGQSFEGAFHWFPFNCGLPLTWVSDMEMHPSGDFMVASTYGRGAYRRSFEELAVIAPDAYDTGTRNDDVKNAPLLGTVAETHLKPGLEAEDLNFDRPNDVDFFTIQLPQGVDECLPEGDASLNDPRVTQGSLLIAVHAPANPLPFELRLYRSDGHVFRDFTASSNLTYTLKCPRRHFSDGKIVLSVRTPSSCVTAYDLWFYYHGWYSVMPAPDLNYKPPLLRVVPAPEDMIGLFPTIPDDITGGYLGRKAVFAEQRVTFPWTQETDFLAGVSVEGTDGLAITLYDSSNRVVTAASAPATGVGGSGGGAGLSTATLEASDLPAGWYTLGFSGGTLPTYYDLHFETLPEEAVTFRRGDANDDGRTDISDGIGILNYLFLGGPAPRCMEAANANDDARLDLSDSLTIFRYLFLGATAPPPPGPSTCGPDGTPPMLAPCESASCP